MSYAEIKQEKLKRQERYVENFLDGKYGCVRGSSFGKIRKSKVKLLKPNFDLF